MDSITYTLLVIYFSIKKRRIKMVETGMGTVVSVLEKLGGYLIGVSV